ncbi:hypothetical protein ACFW04_013925 [Cataglyphis niger]
MNMTYMHVNEEYDRKVRGISGKKGVEAKCGKVKNLKVQERKKKRKECKLEIEREGIEEVKEFTYLGYIRDRLRKGAAVIGQVWEIGKRKFRNDWGKRLWLFDKLVWTVMGYEVKIWGWSERKELGKLQKRNLRWVLGLDWGTPGYIIKEELQREKLRGRDGRRAWRFEKRFEKSRESEIARRCWEELRKRCRRKKELSK